MARSQRREAVMRQLAIDIGFLSGGLSGDIFESDAREVAVEIEALIECVVEEKMQAALDLMAKKR